MNTLVENNLIEEIAYGTNFAYVLNKECTFLPTEYKVLHAQRDNGFLKCLKTYYNGKVQLFYLTESFVPLNSLLFRLNPDSFLTFVSGLLGTIIDVKNNGFLSCMNIDLSYQHIFVDPKTLKVSLVYIPVGQHLFSDYASFENKLRISLIKLISEVQQLSSPSTVNLKNDLQNGSMSIEDIAAGFGGHAPVNRAQNRTQSVPGTKSNHQSAARVSMKLISLNPGAAMEIAVTKPEFVIGKKASAVDGVVSFNRMISRIHCKITQKQSTFFIEDLQSVNGTYVNGKRLSPHAPTVIKHGDIVSLANSDFQVKI
jgi:pSer/pThr/pTyr-binding forkhead associated (FHA) protein